MKTSVIVFGLAMLTAEASSVGPLHLPRSEFADTEASTNVLFALGPRGVRNIRFALTFVGTASNNVQVAFGRDWNADGVLAATETGFAFEWDCGGWTVRGPSGDGLRAAAVTTNAVKDLRWDLRLWRRRPNGLTVRENGEEVFADFARQPANWLFDPDWNIVRLTVRGVDASAEEAYVGLNIQGYLLHVR